tara:strand:+ start:255 stop:557 length:303 start_codon:yes stop_codon:yes gene_type:complete
MEKVIPNATPAIVAKNPIKKPVKKKDFTIDVLDKPSDLNIAISLVLFLMRIVKPEMILKAATTIIRVSIKNITFLSTFKAEKKVLLRSAQEKTYKFGSVF